MLTKKTMCVLTSLAMAIAGTFADTVIPALVELNDIPGDTKILTNAVDYINSVAGGGGGGGSASKITDGTNTIDAARNVYQKSYSPWLIYSTAITNYSPPIVCTYKGTIATTNIFTGTSETWDTVWVSAEKINMSDAAPSYLGILPQVGTVIYLEAPTDGIYPLFTGDALEMSGENQIIAIGPFACDIRRQSKYDEKFVGKLALTNDIPDSRDVTDLGVRGLPQGEGDWFTVTGLPEDIKPVWNDGYWTDNLTIEKTQDGYNITDGAIDAIFTLDENFSAIVLFGEDTLKIIGYVDNLATQSDITHEMVTPGEWSFSGVPSGWSVTGLIFTDTIWTLYLDDGDAEIPNSVYGDGTELRLTFNVSVGGGGIITATRPSLHGHLYDRANNLVKSSDTLQMTLPPPIPNKKSRDFRVRLVITAPITSPNKITFVGATTNGVQESISFEAENGTFPTLNTISTNILHFTETAPSVFLISNKTVLPAPAP